VILRENSEFKTAAFRKLNEFEENTKKHFSFLIEKMKKGNGNKKETNS
jgi:hypothetical protein